MGKLDGEGRAEERGNGERVDGREELREAELHPGAKLIVSGGINHRKKPRQGRGRLVTQQGNTGGFAGARVLDQQGTRCVLLRTGVVLDKHSGAYPQMTQSFKFGVASWMGRGNHWLSWIHLEDMVNGILHCMDTDSISGPVNMTSPQAISHKSFSDAVSAQKRCFIEMGIPAGLMRLLLGEMADELLLTGQHVVPTVLTNTGFAFTCPTIEAAITALET